MSIVKTKKWPGTEDIDYLICFGDDDQKLIPVEAYTAIQNLETKLKKEEGLYRACRKLCSSRAKTIDELLDKDEEAKEIREGELDPNWLDVCDPDRNKETDETDD